jgi:hypothetical protein
MWLLLGKDGFSCMKVADLKLICYYPIILEVDCALETNYLFVS